MGLFGYLNPTSSNQLLDVTDSSGSAAVLGDFQDGNNYNQTGKHDYGYDGNGNLTGDNNKGISAISYDYLNQPLAVTSSKGTIQEIYDATGNKWKKIVTDQTHNPVIVTTTSYQDGFIYNNDTLQYFGQEDGRIRVNLINPMLGYTPSNIQYVYDYFLQDHLGNVRMVLSEQTREDTYGATMETNDSTVEEALFYNISSTRYATPTGFDNPIDTANHYVSKLNASTTVNKPAGPAIVLKVMAGDTLNLATWAWYQGSTQPPANNPNFLTDLLNALTPGVIGSSGGKINGSESVPLASALTSSVDQFFTSDENKGYQSAQPKAFLNYVVFDEQFNMDSIHSGVVQVPTITTGMSKQPLVAPTIYVPRNGYLYIYVSNESPQDVFFDSLVIKHNHGPLLQEDHFYPFGLAMNGISSKALFSSPNNYKFNGGTELDSSMALDWYETGYRVYDEQIGRFHQQDPLAEGIEMMSPYQFVADNPIAFNDPSGLYPIRVPQEGMAGQSNLIQESMDNIPTNPWEQDYEITAAGTLSGAQAQNLVRYLQQEQINAGNPEGLSFDNLYRAAARIKQNGSIYVDQQNNDSQSSEDNSSSSAIGSHILIGQIKPREFLADLLGRPPGFSFSALKLYSIGLDSTLLPPFRVRDR